jgi:pyruvate dehydrogenase E1 component alpha subunit
LLEKDFLEESKTLLPPEILSAFGDVINQWGAENPWAIDPLVGLGPEDWKRFFYQAELIRRFEERCSQLYGMGKIWGFCHLYIGQEAVAIGAYSAKQDKDSVITAYRDHGHILAGGGDPKKVMAELCGKETGFSKGKGGSMHLFDPENNFWGGHGIVGSSSSLGTGLALSHKYLEDGGVCLTFFGDGAANQGQLYESFNMASLWGLPVVFVVENNFYSMGTALWRGCAGQGLYQRAQPFGIPSFPVNGMDFLQTRAAFSWAIEHARSQSRPVFLEMMTYRYRGHSMSDPGNYRTKQEVDFVKQWDPVENIKHYAMAHGDLQEQDIAGIKKQVKEEMLDVVKFCEDSLDPSAAFLRTDIFQGDC